jgi:hypothetical protein
MTDQPSPLAEADPKSLQEIFDEITEASPAEFRKAIQALRELRVKHDAAERVDPKRKAPKFKDAKDVSLEDLGL